MPKQAKVGLVLSGGGAKGAYQVGVSKALAELGTQVDMIAGASIGALNGGILASANNLAEGTVRLEKLWQTLAKASPLKANIPSYIKLLVAAGGVLVPPARLLALAVGAQETSLLCDEPLNELMSEYLEPQRLAKGLPLYVSVFKSLGAATDLGRCLLAAAGIKDTPDSVMLHLQSLPVSEQKNALLASAALPALFKAREVQGQKYTDGGQGGWSKSQGNTPIQPLIDAGCNMVIVTHLSDGALWSRHDFPDTTILEIRPQSPITREGGAKDLLGFDGTKIPSWIEQGYRDTMHCMKRVQEATQARSALVAAKQTLAESEARAIEVDAERAAIMALLRGE